MGDLRDTGPRSSGVSFLACDDPNTAIPCAAKMGRHADTIGAAVGSIAGAFSGRSGLEDTWAQKALQDKSNRLALAENSAAVMERRMLDRREQI